ncbi:hypothetical protein ASPVEDRAFT_89543 [Aspergillus versicolor CBS 583.65]|uniref:Ketoreductase (KR) domain-containing protein n=1 Tax=Aspergillus versicolor CBS 583.65 TaxID=1036611 RepID=A0A1L9Q3G3_ASPVE|nr:uncharacterized protein ASPVEDRAFT_89543 [Aspergillus versicolor CBS 583.65]OJJ08315.1 hypothetical protein ASPVEDRAFT_89543 [Aspergillus versicolor CBS 583.65]
MTLLGSVVRQFVSIPTLPASLSVKGQTVFITGANTGLGLAAARECVGRGAAKVILAVRNHTNGDAAKRSIQQSHPSAPATIDIWDVDLLSFDSVLAIGKRAAQLPRLDIALLNAGVFKFAWSTSANGYETGLQVNHLATALLALTLLPTLKKTAQELGSPSRLTFTSAETHMFTKFAEQAAEKPLDQLNKKELYKDAMDRYCVTKLLNVFWARELAARTSRDEVIVNYFNPGAVDTGIHRDGNLLIRKFDRYVGRSVEQGASLMLNAAVVKGAESHGEYMSEGAIKPPSDLVLSDAGAKLQKTLWNDTEAVLKMHVPEGMDSIFKI